MKCQSEKMPRTKTMPRCIIDERTPPELRRELIRRIEAKGPERLGFRIKCRFRIIKEGDTYYFEHRKEQEKQVRRRSWEEPMQDCMLPPEKPLERLRIPENACETEIFVSLKDFEDRIIVISEMLGKVGIKDSDMAIAMEICRSIFGIQKEKSLAFSIIYNYRQEGLERKEFGIAAINVTSSFSRLRITSEGIYRPSSLLALGSESEKGYRVPFIKFDDLRQDPIGKLLTLLAINPAYYVATLVDKNNLPPLSDWILFLPVVYFKKPAKSVETDAFAAN